MKHENKCKKKGIKVLPALDDKNPWRNLVEKQQKLAFDPWTDRIERERVLKKVWIVKNTWETQCFKNSYTIFNWSKISFNRSKHTEPSQEIFIAFSIDQKIDSIDRNTQSQA